MARVSALQLAVVAAAAAVASAANPLLSLQIVHWNDVHARCACGALGRTVSRIALRAA